MKSLDYIQGLEKAIQEKYGDDAIRDPRSTWNEEKEREYQRQRQELLEERKGSEREKEDVGGFLVSRKLLNRKDDRTCPICKEYSFKIRDDVYVKKYECCYSCFVQHVEGREDKWEEKKRKLLNDNG